MRSTIGHLTHPLEGVRPMRQHNRIKCRSRTAIVLKPGTSKPTAHVMTLRSVSWLIMSSKHNGTDSIYTVMALCASCSGKDRFAGR